MKKRNPVRNRQAKKKSGARAKYVMLAAACGAIFIASLFFAARQHFSSIEYSIKNARLRKQVDELENGKRQLQLAREVSLSPAEIKKSAKKIGLLDVTETVAQTPTAIVPAVEPAKLARTATAKPSEPAKLVQKTVQSSPVLIAEIKKPVKKDPLLRERRVQQVQAAGE